MTTQDWAIIGAGWLALAIVIAGFWLDQRQLAKRLHRHRRQLDQLAGTASAHGAALARADLLPTTSHRPMPTVGRMRASIERRPPTVLPPPAPTPERSDIEQALADAGRPLTRMELGRKLGLAPWEMLGPIKALMLAGKVTMTTSHTDGEPGYWLAGEAGDTLRLPSGMVAGHG